VRTSSQEWWWVPAHWRWFSSSRRPRSSERSLPHKGWHRLPPRLLGRRAVTRSSMTPTGTSRRCDVRPLSSMFKRGTGTRRFVPRRSSHWGEIPLSRMSSARCAEHKVRPYPCASRSTPSPLPTTTGASRGALSWLGSPRGAPSDHCSLHRRVDSPSATWEQKSSPGLGCDQ
jgi:hypothetical protein